MILYYIILYHIASNQPSPSLIYRSVIQGLNSCQICHQASLSAPSNAHHTAPRALCAPRAFLSLRQDAPWCMICRYRDR